MKKTKTDNELFEYLINETNEKFDGREFSYLESTVLYKACMSRGMT
ncbi:MAG: hypothetical protein GX045_03145 [Clostridiaceae bacterium]|jgi:hypothetical protein|nr:hypothetical protein [Clostridiaceae bacterium]